MSRLSQPVARHWFSWEAGRALWVGVGVGGSRTRATQPVVKDTNSVALFFRLRWSGELQRLEGNLNAKNTHFPPREEV